MRGSTIDAAGLPAGVPTAPVAPLAAVAERFAVLSELVTLAGPPAEVTDVFSPSTGDFMTGRLAGARLQRLMPRLLKVLSRVPGPG